MAGFWIDDTGKRWTVPGNGKLRPTERAGHAALRRFVFTRDKFTCVICGAKAIDKPDNYDGISPVYAESKTISGYPCLMHVDHKEPRHRGGTNHPSNLQAVCESCNCRKSGR